MFFSIQNIVISGLNHNLEYPVGVKNNDGSSIQVSTVIQLYRQYYRYRVLLGGYSHMYKLCHVTAET